MTMYIFLLMISSATMLLYFSSLQSALSKNQITKVQAGYSNEKDLNNLIYDDENRDKHIKDEILKRYRTVATSIHKYPLDIKDDDKLKGTIEDASFEIKNIDNREVIYLSIASKYEGIVSNILASGTFINDIFESNKAFLNDDTSFVEDKEMLLDFISKMEEENWNYDPKIISKAKKINTNNNLAIEFIEENKFNLLSQKKLIKNFGETNEIHDGFYSDSMIIHLKREGLENKKITVGIKGDEDNGGLITMAGVLYLEGDLIVNEDFDFEGIVMINGGDIVISEGKRLAIRGMLLSKDSEIDISSIDLECNQKNIYKSASFLPGFLDIDIDVIKKLQ